MQRNVCESTDIADALTFLDDALQQPTSASTDGVGSMLSLGGDEWDDQLLDDYTGDFGLDYSTVDQATTDSTCQSSTQADQEQENPKRRRRKKQLNPNKARAERRFQLAQLRKEAEDLELTLKQWQDIRRKEKLSTDPKKTDKSGVNDRDRDVPAVWKEICANQLRRRLKAERENIRLKQQYKEEMQLVKRVEKLLFKRRDVPQSEAHKHIRRTNLPPGYIKHIAARIFEELSAGIEVCYLLGKNVLGVDGSIPADMASRMPLLRGGVKGTERALFDRRVLPFTRQATDHAWWHSWHSYRGHKGEIADNVVVERFGLEMSDFKTNTSVTSYGQQILRRDVEDDLTVIVWNAYLEPFAFENEQVSGIYFLEQCHMIVKPEDERTAINEGECSTCMSGCYRITPYFLDPTLQSDPRTIRLIDFLVGALFSNMKAHNDMIEDLLLEQVLQKHSNK